MVLGVNEENFFIKIFLESFIGYIVAWFQHLEEGSITRWKVLEDAFLTRFEKDEDVYSFLSSFFQIKKREDAGIQEFID